ncbi:MAG: permease, partial [Giesbergeria sp.]
MTHAQAAWTMVGATFLWSIAGVVTRQLEQARSFEVTFWRSVFTFASLLVLLPLVRGRGAFAPLVRGGRGLWLSGVCW